MEKSLKILVTGAKGFIGKNLIAELRNQGYYDIFEFSKNSDQLILDEFCRETDFVFHLAGVNRPKEQSEFMNGNYGFLSTVLDTLKKHNNACPIMIASSIQAELDNPYFLFWDACLKLREYHISLRFCSLYLLSRENSHWS